MDTTDHTVLASVEHDLLRPEIVERAIELAIDELRPDGNTLNQRRAEILAEIRRLDSELSHLTSAVAVGGDLPVLLARLEGTPGLPEALRARLARAGCNRSDRAARAFTPGARDLSPPGRLARDAAARGPRGARDPPEPDRRPDRVDAPPRGSRLRVVRAGVVRTAAGGNHQSSFNGDPGGIRTRDLDLERVASWARLDDGVNDRWSVYLS